MEGTIQEMQQKLGETATDDELLAVVTQAMAKRGLPAPDFVSQPTCLNTLHQRSEQIYMSFILYVCRQSFIPKWAGSNASPITSDWLLRPAKKTFGKEI